MPYIPLIIMLLMQFHGEHTKAKINHANSMFGTNILSRLTLNQACIKEILIPDCKEGVALTLSSTLAPFNLWV